MRPASDIQSCKEQGHHHGTTATTPPHASTHTHTPTQPRDPADFVAKQLLTTTVTQLEVGR